jgi:hypothetical protein
LINITKSTIAIISGWSHSISRLKGGDTKRPMLKKLTAVIISAALIAGASVIPVLADTGASSTGSANVAEAGGRTVSAETVKSTASRVKSDDETDDQTDEDNAIIKVYLVRNNTRVRVNGKKLKRRGWFFKKSVNGKKSTVAMVPMRAVAGELGTDVKCTSYGWILQSTDSNVLIFDDVDIYLHSNLVTNGLSTIERYGTAPVIRKGTVYVPAEMFEDLYNMGSEKMSVKLNTRKNIVNFSFIRNLKVKVNGRTLKTRGWYFRNTAENGEKTTVAMVPVKAVADALDADVRKISGGWAVRFDGMDALIYKGKNTCSYSGADAAELSASESYGAVPVERNGVVYVPADVFEKLIDLSGAKITVKLNEENNFISFNF